jgi:hypothetical protein
MNEEIKGNKKSEGLIYFLGKIVMRENVRLCMEEK